jgi:phosphoribosyl 1,2-cyclic phosphodiesterase
VLRFRSLGSGSSGNALVVEAHDGLSITRVLVDNGFGPRQLGQRLAAASLAIDDLHAVIVTHEHSDHASGVGAILKRNGIPLLASRGTASAIGLDAGARFQCLSASATVTVGNLCIRPFAVSHDAAEPLQFVFSDGRSRLGLATDLGCAALEVQQALSGVDGLILECNHDAEMLATGGYPAFLKMRIAGDRGHLSNAQSAELLSAIDRSRLRSVVAAHVSHQNNRPEFARSALADVLGCRGEDVVVATQADGFAWQTI